MNASKQRERFVRDARDMAASLTKLHAAAPKNQARKNVQTELAQIERAATTLMQALVNLHHVEGQDLEKEPYHFSTVQALQQGYFVYKSKRQGEHSPSECEPGATYPSGLFEAIRDLQEAANFAQTLEAVGPGNSAGRTEQAELVDRLGKNFVRMYRDRFGTPVPVSTTGWQAHLFDELLHVLGVELADVPRALQRAVTRAAIAGGKPSPRRRAK